jgi:hypothetical protein
MDPTIDSLKLQIADKDKELELYRSQSKEMGELVTTLHSRVESLSKIVSNRHAILDEANKSVAVAVTRNKCLATAMQEAAGLIRSGDSPAALTLLIDTLDSAPDDEPTVKYLEGLTNMRDDVLTAIRLLERSLPGVTT